MSRRRMIFRWIFSVGAAASALVAVVFVMSFGLKSGPHWSSFDRGPFGCEMCDGRVIVWVGDMIYLNGILAPPFSYTVRNRHFDFNKFLWGYIDEMTDRLGSPAIAYDMSLVTPWVRYRGLIWPDGSNHTAMFHSGNCLITAMILPALWIALRFRKRKYAPRSATGGESTNDHGAINAS